MRSATKESALRDDRVVANLDGARVVNFRSITDSDKLPELQVPWRPNASAGVDARSFANFGAKTAQKEPSPGVKRSRAGAEEQKRQPVPKLSSETIAPGMTWPGVRLRGFRPLRPRGVEEYV